MNYISNINRGGFGRVDRYQMPNGDIVARKVFDPLPGVLGADPAAQRLKLLRRFEREVRVQEALNHDFVIPILAKDLSAANPWYVMPMASRSLQEQIASDREEAKRALPDVLNALDQLHALGFVHRDLKPANVLFHDGKWKLSDFGLVLPPAGSTTTLTSPGSAWGTETYAAPEQATDFGNVTAKADIFAFGCILHDIFATGPRVPFHRQTCAGPIGPIVEKCTEIDLQRRFSDIRSLRGVLLSTLTTAPTAVTADATTWRARLADLSAWNASTVQDFARYVAQIGDDHTRYAICVAVDENVITTLHHLDPLAWRAIAICYCNWAEGGFQWDYCDVVIGRLESIYSLPDVEIQASAVVAAAELGASHNRWYVMRRLLELSGPTMPDGIAHRVSIEIAVRHKHRQFLSCASVISEPVTRYHIRIQEELSRHQTQP